MDHVYAGALERLIRQNLTDDHWREVLLLTPSLLPPEVADAFFAAFQRAVDNILRSDQHLLAYSRWATDKANDYAYLGHPEIAQAAAHATAATMSALALIRTLDLARDPASIFTWLFARPKYREDVRRLIAALAQASRRAGQSEFAEALNDLSLPAEEASDGEWQTYANDLQAVLIRQRNIGHKWNSTDKQERRSDQYGQGTVLVAECLKLAAV